LDTHTPTHCPWRHGIYLASLLYKPVCASTTLRYAELDTGPVLHGHDTGQGRSILFILPSTPCISTSRCIIRSSDGSAALYSSLWTTIRSLLHSRAAAPWRHHYAPTRHRAPATRLPSPLPFLACLFLKTSHFRTLVANMVYQDPSPPHSNLVQRLRLPLQLPSRWHHVRRCCRRTPVTLYCGSPLTAISWTWATPSTLLTSTFPTSLGGDGRAAGPHCGRQTTLAWRAIHVPLPSPTLSSLNAYYSCALLLHIVRLAGKTITRSTATRCLSSSPYTLPSAAYVAYALRRRRGGHSS